MNDDTGHLEAGRLSRLTCGELTREAPGAGAPTPPSPSARAALLAARRELRTLAPAELVALAREGGEDALADALGVAVGVVRAEVSRAVREAGPVRMLPRPGPRPDCAREAECLGALLRAHPKAWVASCPEGCPAFTPPDARAERDEVAVSRPGE